MTEPLSQDQIELLRSLPREFPIVANQPNDLMDMRDRGFVRFRYTNKTKAASRTPAGDTLVTTIDAIRGQVLSEIDAAAEKLAAPDQAAEILIHHDKPNWVCGQDGATGRHVHVTRDDEVFTADALTEALFAATRTPAEGAQAPGANQTNPPDPPDSPKEEG